MKYLLANENRELLETLWTPHTLFGFDFDGTLAPISSNPDSVQIDPACLRYIEILSQQAPVAVLTGRSLKDIESRLPFTPKYLIGNHGIEGHVSEERLCQLKKLILNNRVMIEAKFAADLAALGIALEDKIYSLTLHFRNSKVPHEAEKFLMTKLGNFADLWAKRGHMVINLFPKEGPHKGLAFQRIVQDEGVTRSFFVGDDLTDEDVFSQGIPGLVSVRIGEVKDSAAQYYLRHREELLSVLKILTRN